LSKKKKILIVLALLIVLVAVYFAIGLKRMYTPTEGRMIDKYDVPEKAVLVIDVQEDFSGLNGRKPVPLQDVEPQIDAINRILENAAGSAMKVAYIRQVFENTFFTRLFIKRAIEGQPGVELDARVKVINDNDFTKKISDAFSNPELDEFLVSKNVDEIYLVGLDAAYCVYYTALGGLNRGYKVTVVTDAVMTTKDMDNILKLYATHGINMITTDEFLTDVLSAKRQMQAK